MAALDDLSQKIIVVVLFTSVFAECAVVNFLCL